MQSGDVIASQNVVISRDTVTSGFSGRKWWQQLLNVAAPHAFSISFLADFWQAPKYSTIFGSLQLLHRNQELAEKLLLSGASFQVAPRACVLLAIP